MTQAQRNDLLRRMARAGCQMYVKELAKGLGASQAETVEALSTLEADGLVMPVSWRVTETGREAAA